MKVLRHVTILLYAIVLVSCNTDSEVMPVDESFRGVLLTEMETVYNKGDVLITIVANGVAFSDKVGVVDIIGYFIDSLGNETYAESFAINGEAVNEYKDIIGVYRRAYGFDGYKNEDGAALFGDFLTIEVEGVENLPGFAFRFYMPELINFIDYDHGGLIDTDSDLTLTWTTDPNHADGVKIALWGYDSSKTILPSSWDTEDDGMYTIPRSDLQQFENMEFIKIGIQRTLELTQPLSQTSDYKAVVTTLIYDVSKKIPVSNSD